ncbi:hypothetical protein, partial [Candidatus Binatus sp.]|uniref:hypothetical protein n=1 Tax=Candidatus Binatus sp. TaxID=2811406 RepID=UPI003CC5B749
WVQLGAICDVAETLRARPAIDLMAILDEATTLGSRRMFLTSMLLAHELAGAPRPDELVAVARNDRNVSAIARRVASGLFRGAGRAATPFDPWAVPIRSIEGTGAQIYYVVQRTLAPTMGDYELIPLPRPLFPLYWLIRPFRMAAQYGPRLVRKQ